MWWTGFVTDLSLLSMGSSESLAGTLGVEQVKEKVKEEEEEEEEDEEAEDWEESFSWC